MRASKPKDFAVEKLKISRDRLLKLYPFYGELVMHMKFGFAECQTAFTDMERIVFDRAFVNRITVDEICFVLQHEILHCVLQHIPRSRGLHHRVYNIAADIVINSNILREMGCEEMEVDNSPVMHTVPDGSEGYLYTAEEVYEMLISKYHTEENVMQIWGEAEHSVDRHDVWENVGEMAGDSLQEEWNLRVEKACSINSQSVPGFIRETFEVKDSGKIDWRKVLQGFVLENTTEMDYSFCPPNKNYIYMDLNYPQYNEVDLEQMESIFFFVDTSGSISKEDLSDFLSELHSFVLHIENKKCKLFFFDTNISEPIEIDHKNAIKEVNPIGGGGTDFGEIFRFLSSEYADNPPKGIVVLTDGWSAFPEESAAMGIPVLWIYNEEGASLPPFGKHVYMLRELGS